MRASKPISVTLGKFQEKVDAWVESGAYASASEVVRAGLRALEREEDWLLRRKIDEAYDDPAPSIPAAEVFAELRALVDASLNDPRPDRTLDEVFDGIEQRHAERRKAAKRGS